MKDSAQTILAALARGERLTPLITLRNYSIFSLAQRVSELRAMGFPIESKRVKGEHYHEYRWAD